VNRVQKLRKQRNGKTHRNANGIYFQHIGGERFIVAVRSGCRGWVYGRIIWKGDFDRVELAHVMYFSQYEFPTYRQAIEAAHGR